MEWAYVSLGAILIVGGLVYGLRATSLPPQGMVLVVELVMYTTFGLYAIDRGAKMGLAKDADAYLQQEIVRRAYE